MQETIPLHPAQYDILKAQLINPDSPAYNVGGYIKLKGLLNKKVFKDVVKSAPKSFDVFKMRFHINETHAVCSFDKTYDQMTITELDFSNCHHPDADAKKWMKQRFNIAFALHNEQELFENVLIKIAADEHWFYMRYHHLIMDGYGFKVWLQHLARTYQLLVTCNRVADSYPPYADEISKAHEYRNSSVYKLESIYWEERIAEKPKKILQSRYHNNKGQKSSTFTYQLSDNQEKQLEELRFKTNLSRQQLTVAALLIIFGKTTAVTDFVFGIPLHKRESRRMRNIVGMFSSVLPFKATYQPNVKLINFLCEIAVLLKRDYRRKNYLIGDISRNLHLNPLSDILCEVLVNYEALNLELQFDDAIQATAVQLVSDYENTPLQLCWQDFGKQQPLQLQLTFREDYFSKDEITLLAKRIFFIFEQFPEKLTKEVGSIDILLTEEAQLLQLFNNTAADYPIDKPPVELFELQAAQTPNRKAVIYKENNLTFQQLDKKANQLARFLKQKGLKDGDLVPICIERSLEMIIGIVGILKCGATYVPVDPAYPLERIHFILEDTGAKLAVTSTLSQDMLPVSENIEFICIDNQWELICKQPSQCMPVRVSPYSLAYVIYTSGSTGRPKGVQMPGRNLVNLLMWQEQQFKHTHRHVLQFASLNFDVSFQEIFSTLCFGSTLVLISDEHRSNAPELLGEINHHGITHLFLPYVMLISFAEHAVRNSIYHLPIRTIVVAGEQLKLTKDILQLLHTGGIQLINQYGPTETHVVSSYTIHPNSTLCSLPPIGKPISNIHIYVLDSQCNQLPIGVVGEICIAGTGVAKGYLHNEHLTAEKFVADPFGNGKMYRTGDLGRWLPDGNLEFLGRIDDQVKIRGHRVEIGEIESVLQQCDLVSRCVVMTKENKDGYKQLVSYIVPKKDFDRKCIVSFLEARLPGYMIPSWFIPLEALPVTQNGKVDKRALPDPDTIIANECVAPRTPLEETLVKIWKQVLNIRQVSIHDNFFELGGHSLLLVETIAEIEKQTRRKLSLSSLYQYPTVEKFAAFLLEKRLTESCKYIVPLKTGGAKMPLYIICHIGIAPLSRFIPFAYLLDHEQPVFGLHLPEVTKWNATSISVEAIAANYVLDLLAQNPKGPYSLAGYSIGGVIAFEMAKQLQTIGKEVRFLCLLDTLAYTEETLRPRLKMNRFNRRIIQLYTILKELFLAKKILRRYSSPKQKTKKEVPPEETLKLSIAAYKKYKLSPYEGNMILLRAKNQKINFKDNKYLGWKPYIKSIKVYDVEGNHYTMFHPTHCKHLAKLMQRCLDECNWNTDN